MSLSLSLKLLPIFYDDSSKHSIKVNHFNHLEVRNSGMLTTLTMLCSPHHYPFADSFLLQTETLYPLSTHSHSSPLPARCYVTALTQQFHYLHRTGISLGIHTVKQIHRCHYSHVAKRWKQPECPLTDDWACRRWHVHTMECMLQHGWS